jgi:hypothetical protein
MYDFKLTKQQAFDIMWKGLTSQGWNSSIEAGVCQYRTYTGLKCAIGHLIPDDIAQQWEGRSVGTLVEVEDLSPRNRKFYERAQEVHDGSSNPNNMQARFRALAVQFNLTIPEEV